jgi:FKBP-type peptidyl-prolyl cis-trans isomerase FklB
MKHFLISTATVLLALTLNAQDKSASPAPNSASAANLKDLKDKVSYSIGLNIGFNFKKQGVDLNPDALLAGVKDSLANKPALTENEVRDTMTAFSKELSDKQKQAGDKNKADGEKFLADNKKKDGVKTTASGLEYKVIKEGSGPSPTATDTVTVNYRGTLIDGTEFDSSYKRGEPATFPVGGVIKGWTEALQMMKKGAKYQLWIPSNLAYGPNGAGGEIGPNSTLIFEVELVDIKPGGAAGGPPSGGEKEERDKKP